MGRSKEPKTPSKYFCSLPECGESFSKLGNLRRHTQIVHEKIKDPADFKYRCDVVECGKKFRKRKQFYDHKFTVHDSERKSKYACSRCSSTFPTPTKLKVHMKHHDGYECSDCNFKGETWSTLRRHKAKEHRVMRKCGVCEKEFSSWFRMKKHQRVHELAIKCPNVGCEMELLPQRMARHVRTVHGSSVPDGRQLRQIDDVIASVLQDDAPVRPVFECTDCGKKFPKERNRRLHIRNIHLGNSEKIERKASFRCTVEKCTSRFTTASKLENHLNCHMGVKPLECPEINCAARFAGRSALQRHVKLKHLKSLLVYEAAVQVAQLCRNGDCEESDDGEKIMK